MDGVWTQTVKATVVGGLRRAPFGKAKIPVVLVLFMGGCVYTNLYLTVSMPGAA